jgi:hypothetical protein
MQDFHSVPDDRLYPDGSWWSKLDRAKRHLEDLQNLVAAYSVGRQHPVTSRLKSHSKPKTWEYRVFFDGEPSPEWSTTAGDFLFDARAALDHIIIALNPPEMKNRLILFPIYGDDPWRRTSGTRCYVERDPANRRNFSEAVKRLHPEARAYIKWLQPYAATAESGLDVTDHTLAILKKLNNIDKHRRLLVCVAGCNGARIRYPLPDGTTFEGVYEFPAGMAGGNGGLVAELPFQVDVEFMASLTVGFRWRGAARGEPSPPSRDIPTLCRIIETVECHLQALEPFIP